MHGGTPDKVATLQMSKEPAILININSIKLMRALQES